MCEYNLLTKYVINFAFKFNYCYFQIFGIGGDSNTHCYVWIISVLAS